MRQSGDVVRPFSYAARLLIRGSSSGAPNWHQPRQSSPSKTSAAWAVPLRTRSSFRSRFSAAVVSLPTPSGWNPMHQQPPKMPLFRSTSAANASHVDSSRALIVYVDPPMDVQSSPAPERFNFTRDVVERADPGALALRFVDSGGGVRDLSFGDVAEQAARWAGLLRRSGVRPGDRVLVLVGKTPEWHAIMLAALKTGAVAIPCSEMLRAKDLDFRVRHSGARLLVADPQCRAEVEAMAEAPTAVFVDEAALGEPDIATADTAAYDNALILYTSGTTKDPKGVVHTHRYTWAKRAQAAGWLDARPGDVVWCTAGTGWAKSIWNVLLWPWSCGAAIVLHGGGFEPSERYRLLEELRPTVVFQAPTEYRLMAKVDGMDGYE